MKVGATVSAQVVSAVQMQHLVNEFNARRQARPQGMSDQEYRAFIRTNGAMSDSDYRHSVAKDKFTVLAREVR